jgi:S-adenosylmethionine:tRNA ribosyltransferase-isomerase
LKGAPDSGRPDWLADYDYDLPEERIARRPAEPRDSSRLLVLHRDRGEMGATVFSELPGLLKAGDLLVLNETRVLPARLRSKVERTGRAVEILLSHPDEEDASGSWLAMLGPARRLRSGDRLRVGPGGAEQSGSVVLIAPAEHGMWRLRAEGTPMEMLMSRCGHIPLPPYLRREDATEDRDWYQTVFASQAGAVAAPTAGLHFTRELLARVEAAGVETTRIILHVGPGTFLPVRAGSLAGHRVPAERFSLPGEAVEAVLKTRAAGGRVIAVGTTTVRVLETAAHAAGGFSPGSGWTGLTIVPGHSFRVVDGLITNFHLPRSSLLLLVCAFAGRERVLAAYAAAREAGFRFYSYGDAMLIL